MPAADPKHLEQGFVRRATVVQHLVCQHQIIGLIWDRHVFSVRIQRGQFNPLHVRQLKTGQVLKIGQRHVPKANFAQDISVLVAPADN